MRVRNKVCYTVIFSIVLISCNSREKVLEEINLQLETRIMELENKEKSKAYSPIVISKDRVVSINDSFMADIKLAVIDDENPPIVVLYEFDEATNTFLAPIDTLDYNHEYHTSTIVINPQYIGLHKIFGKVYYNVTKDTINQYGFQITFEAVN